MERWAGVLRAARKGKIYDNYAGVATFGKD
jgi:hypothetical protein